ncbi:hypothetical protein KP509_01G038400 [Ceratopteris richardii]|uniref:Serine aminopeptidase S33 domain-containing protein n=1 Tax=Ceratopteris richardii TaxID=49495 RepID=A0A8T2VKF3_CERRI|nr:hypothetical protein KP509_01G038400 [Ceratopteris richardii]
MESSCAESRTQKRSVMITVRSVWEIATAFRALRMFVFAVYSMFMWLLFICRFKYVRVSTSPVFESIELEEVEKSGGISPETSKIKKKRRILWTRSLSCDANCRRVLARKRLANAVDGDISSWQTHFFVNSRKQILFVQSWMPTERKQLRGLLILLHGLNEHSGRYLHFAMQLNSQGYGVYAMDWIGHGGSDGLHGYVPSLDHVVADTVALLQWVLDKNPSLPCFLFGHSTGGAVVLKLACEPLMSSLLQGIILTSPALRVIAPVISMLLPTLQFKGANKRGIPVSRDPAQLVAKYSDPLVYTGPLRIRTGSEILRITNYLQRNMNKVTVPFLVMHGTGDRVTDPSASQDFYHCAASKHKRLKLYEGYLHDLLFEPEREEIAEDIIKWMDEILNTIRHQGVS